MDIILFIFPLSLNAVSSLNTRWLRNESSVFAGCISVLKLVPATWSAGVMYWRNCRRYGHNCSQFRITFGTIICDISNSRLAHHIDFCELQRKMPWYSFYIIQTSEAYNFIQTQIISLVWNMRTSLYRNIAQISVECCCRFGDRFQIVVGRLTEQKLRTALRKLQATERHLCAVVLPREREGKQILDVGLL